jgi:WD40 repeat protein
VITSIAVNGLRFGIASDDGTASVWEIADACKVRKLACLTGHTRYVLSISLGLQQIATGSADGTVRLYHADNFALVRVIDNKNGAWVWSVCVFGGNFVLCSATDGTARVVTINDGNSAVRVDVPYDARDAVILEDGRIAIACYNFVALRPTPAVIAKAYNSSCDGDVEKGNKERSLND